MLFELEKSDQAGGMLTKNGRAVLGGWRLENGLLVLSPPLTLLGTMGWCFLITSYRIGRISPSLSDACLETLPVILWPVNMEAGIVPWY